MQISLMIRWRHTGHRSCYFRIKKTSEQKYFCEHPLTNESRTKERRIEFVHTYLIAEVFVPLRNKDLMSKQ